MRLPPSRRSLRADQAMTLGVRTSNGASTSTAMARMRGQMGLTTAEAVRTCMGPLANLVLTSRPHGLVRSGRIVFRSPWDIPQPAEDRGPWRARHGGSGGIPHDQRERQERDGSPGERRGDGEGRGDDRPAGAEPGGGGVEQAGALGR